MSCRLVVSLALLVLALSHASDRPVSGQPPLPAVVRTAATSWLVRNLAAWDAPVGRRVLLLAERIILRPAAAVLSALPAVVVSPENVTAVASALQTEVAANATKLTMEGLSTLRPFVVSPNGHDTLDATSSFGQLRVAMEVDASWRGPLGLRGNGPLVMRAEVNDCRFTVTWTCRVDPVAIRAAMTGAAPMATATKATTDAIVVSPDAVHVSIDGELAVRLDGLGLLGAVPPFLWRVLSRALSSPFKHAVEVGVAEAILDALKARFEPSLRESEPEELGHSGLTKSESTSESC